MNRRPQNMPMGRTAAVHYNIDDDNQQEEAFTYADDFFVGVLDDSNVESIEANDELSEEMGVNENERSEEIEEMNPRTTNQSDTSSYPYDNITERTKSLLSNSRRLLFTLVIAMMVVASKATLAG